MAATISQAFSEFKSRLELSESFKKGGLKVRTLRLKQVNWFFAEKDKNSTPFK